ncbi:hypothetical protein ACEU6E_01760 [Halorutilales archaeon Cl-col2-1]
MYTPREHRHGNILLLLLVAFTGVGVLLTANPERGAEILDAMTLYV